MKQTEIGLIPDDWEVKRLGDICDLLNGDRSSNYPKDDEMVSIGIPFINAGHLKNGKVDFDEMDYITSKHYRILSGAKIQKGDILFCLRGSLGKNAIATFNDGAPASSLCVFRHKKIDEFFLFQLINSALFEKQIIDANSGSSQPNLSAKDVSNFKIPISKNLEELKRIAKALSDVDALISTTEKLIQKKKNIKQGTMQNLLTGKKRLPDFAPQTKSSTYKQTELGPIPEDWEVKEFKQEATLINGRAYAQSELLKQGKYKVLRVGNFGTNDTWYYSDLELPENQYCKKDDLLYCWSCTYGAYIWNEEKTIYHYHIWKIIPKGADKEYLKYILNNDTENQMKSSNGSTMSHITKGFLENRVFIFPPLAEQQQIANVLSSMDKEIETLNTKLEKYRNLKTAMMQQLLTGKIRLIK